MSVCEYVLVCMHFECMGRYGSWKVRQSLLETVLKNASQAEVAAQEKTDDTLLNAFIMAIIAEAIAASSGNNEEQLPSSGCSQYSIPAVILNAPIISPYRKQQNMNTARVFCVNIVVL